MAATTPLPLARTCPFAPVSEHVRLRQEEPVTRVTLPSGSQVWAITRHQDVRAMLASPHFSANRMRPGIPHMSVAQTHSAPGTPLITVDGAEHLRQRRDVTGEFTLKRIAGLEARLQQIVDDRIDVLLAGPRPADFVETLALPVPSLAICELLGVPYAEHDFFQERTGEMLRRTATREEQGAAMTELIAYLDELMARKEREPGDDLLTRLLDRTGDRKTCAGFGVLLLVAGHETTANMISLGTMMLLENPESLQALREDPAKTPGAVEEMLRYFTVGEYAVVRVAVEDTEIGGTVIHAGEGAIALCNTANRDPGVFEAPDLFDISRDTRAHLGFGYGPRSCPGQNLARAELRIVFDTLLRRVPELRLAQPVDNLPFKEDGMVYGLHELPVTW
ncbi:cytochrome P450 [Streptomyces sp. NPDC051016]|uniref:cytochrome P450 n=1 Tax=Streptomyces sp. NPDC051016 TaxID=3365638 RepID=UPI0037ABABC8